MNTHYRSQIDYSDQHLEEAKQSLQKIYNAINKLKTLISDQSRGELKESTSEESEFLEYVEKSKQKFMEAMDDDFNTREAMPAIFELSRIVNSLPTDSKLSRKALEKALRVYQEFGEILGLFQQEKVGADLETVAKLVEILIDLRNKFRKEKNWEKADYIRDKLKEAGILLEDSKDGTIWKIIK